MMPADRAIVKPCRIGVIGIGDISDVYISNLMKYPQVEVIGCASRSLAKAQAKAALHGLAKAYPDSQSLIADPDVDLVLNLTTPAAHFELNKAALLAGKHVYTEKPIAPTYAEAKQLIELAEAKGLSIASAPDTFLGGRLQTCRQLIDDGTLGEIVGASAFVVSHGHEWHHPNPEFFYEPGGGPLLDIGPYYMTALLSLLGPIRSCAGMARRTFDTRTIESQPRRGQTLPVHVDTHITGTFEFVSGAIGTLIASFDVWDSELPRIEIYGTKGTICLRDIDPLDGPNLFGGEIWLRTRDNYRWTGLPRPASLPDWTVVPVTRPFKEISHRTNSRGIGLVDQVESLRNGRPARASGRMALHQIEAMEAILASAHDKTYRTLETTFELPQPLSIEELQGES
jgi:predicted dehydrogenase